MSIRAVIPRVPNTHTHAHAHTHTHTHKDKHTNTHTHKHAHTHTEVMEKEAGHYHKICDTWGIEHKERKKER